MKILRLALFIACLAVPARAPAEKNRYDVLAQTLTPFVGLLLKNPPPAGRALHLTGVLESMTGVAPVPAGTAVELFFQAPDQLLLRAPVFGVPATVCRDGQQLWLTPGAQIEALLDAAVAARKLPRLDPKYRLEPFRLPIPEKQLVFLPALFQVADGGLETVDGQPCRILDLVLPPELERSLPERGWTARLWVRADHRPARLRVARPGWEATVRFASVTFSPALPAATWQPPAGADVLPINPPRAQQLLRALESER